MHVSEDLVVAVICLCFYILMCGVCLCNARRMKYCPLTVYWQQRNDLQVSDEESGRSPEFDEEIPTVSGDVPPCYEEVVKEESPPPTYHWALTAGSRRSTITGASFEKQGDSEDNRSRCP